MQKFYSDYFQPKAEYKPVMTKEELNKHPKEWLSFYPHPSFVKILRELMSRMEKGGGSVWITGTYGSGKSHASLVLQKLFMDDSSHVEEFIAHNVSLLPEEVRTALLAWRGKRPLVVYEYGSDDVITSNQLIYRIERAIYAACKTYGYKVPALSSADQIKERVCRDEKVFFETRDKMQSELAYLTEDIIDAAMFCKGVAKGGKLADGLLNDAELVLQRDNVYLSTSAENLLNWIQKIREENDIGPIVFLWDEFSSYIDHAKGDLKTFEMLAENQALQNGFMFVPVTHMGLEAFLGSGTQNAKKATGRYKEMAIEIPAGHVFHLGEHAFTYRYEAEWKKERDLLWSEVNGMVASDMMPSLERSHTVDNAEDFKCILPLHPMSAILLQRLSEKIGQNTRSFFDYLRKTGEESEFENFLKQSGPQVPGRQFLTADYLWSYFVEQQSVSVDNDVRTALTEFNRHQKTFKWEDSSPEARVYKAILLYMLLDSKSSGEELMAPTIKNIERTFRGDSSIVAVGDIVNRLSKECHCFSIISDHFQRYLTENVAGLEAAKEKWRTQFGALVASKMAENFQREINGFGDSQRYVVRAYDVETVKPSDLNRKSDYGEGNPAGGNKIAMIFLLAKDHEGKVKLTERAREIATAFRGLRVCVAICDNVAFNDKKNSLWEDFVEAHAHYELSDGNEAIRGVYEKDIKGYLNDFFKVLRSSSTTLTLYVSDPKEGVNIYKGLNWNSSLKATLLAIKDQWFERCPDKVGRYLNTAFSDKYSAGAKWAEMGLTGQAPVGQYKALLKNVESDGVAWTEDWAKSNPNHPLAQLQDAMNAKISNAISHGKPFSLRTAYIEFQRAPWGLERNAYSAFVLGFALRKCLERGLQQTNNVVSEPLDVAKLSNIIARVVEVDGGDMKDEWKICKLSKEERAFTEHIGTLFDMNVDPSTTPENVLSRLGDKINAKSGKIPLWMVGEYVKSLKEESAAEQIATVIGNLCEAQRVSSVKSKDNNSRLEKVRTVGKMLTPEEYPGLKEAVAKYLTQENFEKAFSFWLKTNAPQAITLAKEIGDTNAFYLRDEILKRFASEAAWLWTETDVTVGITDIIAEWNFVRVVRKLYAPIVSWLTWEDANGLLQKSLFVDNKISINLLAKKWSFITKLDEYLRDDTQLTSERILEMSMTLEQESETYKVIFRDPSLTALVDSLAEIFANTPSVQNLSKQDWSEIYKAIPANEKTAELGEDSFRSVVANVVNKVLRDSARKALDDAWQKATKSDSPDAWAVEHKLPAEVLFVSLEEALAVLMVMKNPANVSDGDVQSSLAILKVLKTPSIEEMEKRFLAAYFPKRYELFTPKADALSQWLFEKLGDNPNLWRNNLKREDVTYEFVLGDYKTNSASKAKTVVKKMSNEAAKDALLTIIEDFPDAGLRILSKMP